MSLQQKFAELDWRKREKIKSRTQAKFFFHKNKIRVYDFTNLWRKVITSVLNFFLLLQYKCTIKALIFDFLMQN